MPSSRRAHLVLVMLAFASVYLIWGSTYLAIRYAVETLPPLLMAATRWIPAGIALYAWRRARGDAAPTLAHWRTALIVGALLVVGGNGLVSIAETTVASSLAALLVASVPLWMALIEWLAWSKRRPGARVMFGIGVGLAGVALLVGPDAWNAIRGAGAPALVGMALVLLAAFSWANGSLYSRHAPRPESPLLGASMQMIAGGVLLAVGGVARGEVADLDLASVSTKSWLAVAYLAFFGSIIGYTSYVWLLQVVRPEMAGTYAFVNPVVAVILGAWLADEVVTASTLFVGGMIVVAVALIVTAPKPVEKPEPAAIKA